MSQTTDIELTDLEDGRAYCYVIDCASGALDTIYTRAQHESIYSACSAYNVPDKIQLAFYRERAKLLASYKTCN